MRIAVLEKDKDLVSSKNIVGVCLLPGDGVGELRRIDGQNDYISYIYI